MLQHRTLSTTGYSYGYTLTTMATLTLSTSYTYCYYGYTHLVDDEERCDLAHARLDRQQAHEVPIELGQDVLVRVRVRVRMSW